MIACIEYLAVDLRNENFAALRDRIWTNLSESVDS